jgi:hypothetical protein
MQRTLSSVLATVLFMAASSAASAHVNLDVAVGGPTVVNSQPYAPVYGPTVVYSAPVYQDPPIVYNQGPSVTFAPQAPVVVNATPVVVSSYGINPNPLAAPVLAPAPIVVAPVYRAGGWYAPGGYGPHHYRRW